MRGGEVRGGGEVWGGGCAPYPENFSLLTLEKARFGGYLMHSEVLILKLWFAVLWTGCCKVVRPILSVFLRQAAVHGA